MVITGPALRGTVELNAQALIEGIHEVSPGRFEVTETLQPTNELTLMLLSTLSEFEPGQAAPPVEVRLEIEAQGG